MWYRFLPATGFKTPYYEKYNPTVFLCAGTLLLNAQSTGDSIPEPGYINQVFAVGKDHKLTHIVMGNILHTGMKKRS